MAAAIAPRSTKACVELVDWSNTHTRWFAGLGSMTFPCGSLAALETITLVPFAETASTFPMTAGSTTDTTLVAVVKDTNPALVPRYPMVPELPKTSEFGVPGRVMAVPAVAVLVLMGTSVGDVPLGGVKELVAYTVVAGLV